MRGLSSPRDHQHPAFNPYDGRVKPGAVVVTVIAVLVGFAVYAVGSSGPDGMVVGIGRLADFPPGSVTPVTIEARLTAHVPRVSDTAQSGIVEVPIFVVNHPVRGFVVLYASDPHLGCRVVPTSELPPSYDGELSRAAEFLNPCHGEQYDILGRYISGPSPRGLDRFGVSVEGDHLVVKLTEFSYGSPAP